MRGEHVTGGKTWARVLLSYSPASRSAVCNKSGTHILAVTRGRASYCGCGNVAFLKQTCGKAQGAMHQSKPVLSSHVCTQDVCTHVPASQLWAHLWGGRRHTEVSPSVSLVFLLDFHFVSENSWSCCVSFRCTAVIQLIYIYYFSNNFPLDYYRILNRVPCAL